MADSVNTKLLRRRRFLSAALMAVSGVAAAVGALFTLNIRFYLFGPRYESLRYDGVGGAFRGLFDSTYVIFAGAVVFGRLGWLIGQWLGWRIWKEPESGARLRTASRIFDRAFVLPVLLVWIYLIYASW